MNKLPPEIEKIIYSYKAEFEQYELKKRTIEALCMMLNDIQPEVVPYLKRCLFNLFDLNEPRKIVSMAHKLMGYFNTRPHFFYSYDGPLGPTFNL